MTMTSKVFNAMSLLALLLLPIGTVSVQKMKAVDLGLSIKWAPCNVGASSSLRADSRATLPV